MNHWRRRAIMVAAIATGVATAARAAVVALECAEYISTRIDGEPLTGTLIGTETITQTFSVLPSGVGASTTTTFSVGTYEMSDGQRIKVDCRNYTIWA